LQPDKNLYVRVYVCVCVFICVCVCSGADVVSLCAMFTERHYMLSIDKSRRECRSLCLSK